MCQSARTAHMWRGGIRYFYFLGPNIGEKCGGRASTYLDLIGDDGTRTELCADLVCPDRIKVYETESVDVSVALHVLEVTQSGHITLIGVVLPIKLDGDVCQKDRRGTKSVRMTWRKSSWRVRMRVMRSRTAVSTVARETSPCLNTHHLVPPRTVRAGSCSWNCPCCGHASEKKDQINK